MKTIELSQTMPSLLELIDQASKGGVILKTPEGQEFILAAIDDFAYEVELLKNSKEFMEFLDERSKKRASISLADMRKEFGLN